MKKRVKELDLPLHIHTKIFFELIPDCELQMEDEEIILTAKCTHCMQPCIYAYEYNMLYLQDVFCKICTEPCYVKCGHYNCNCFSYVQAKYGIGT